MSDITLPSSFPIPPLQVDSRLMLFKGFKLFFMLYSELSGLAGLTATASKMERSANVGLKHGGDFKKITTV